MADFKSQRSESTNTPEVRVAYPFLHKKRTKRANGSDLKKPRFDATLLVPKLNADPAQCANYQFLMKHCMESATKTWGSFPQGGHWPIQDGDAPPKPKAPIPGQPQAPVDPNKYAWRKGHWVVEVTNYMDPGPRVAVMQNGQATEVPAQTVNGQQMYKSGDFGIAHLHAYSFQNEKFGVNFGFEGVLFTRPGEAIGSSGPKSASAMFGSVAPVSAPTVAPPSPAAAAPYPQPRPQQYAAPPVAPAPQQYAAPPIAPVAPPAPPAMAAPAPGQAPLPPFPGQ